MQDRNVSSIVAIIGAGFGGVGLAIRLKQAGIDFILFEKGAGVGGVWRENTYPGAACDVPSHLYSFSFEPKPDWPRKYAEQPHILEYLEHCARKYDLLKHARFNTEIESARFDETSGLWTLRTKNGEEFQARALVTACGQLNRPATPSLKGLESFRGERFHSALWNHMVDFTGKRVAIVGTGASAIQFVPAVVAKAAKVTLFQRSPPWVMPKPDRVFRGFEKAAMRVVPGVTALYRFATYLRCEARLIGFRKDTWMNAVGVRMAMRHLRRQIPDERLRRQVTPDYTFGCKRVLISNDYLVALSRSNVSVVTESISEVTADAIVAADGQIYPADILILGTGFQATDFLAPMRVIGRGGRDLNEAWRNGAEAYLGLTIPGFPNFFLLYGPNTNLAHNSVVYMIESQIRYILGCLQLLVRRPGAFLDLKPERLQRWEEEMQTRLDRSVWSAGCANWYKNANGRITNNWPGFTFEYRWRTRAPKFEDYELIKQTGKAAHARTGSAHQN